MIAIVDYGVGNLFSLAASLDSLGFPSVVTGEERALREADRIILPGVGAFGDAMLGRPCSPGIMEKDAIREE